MATARRSSLRSAPPLAAGGLAARWVVLLGVACALSACGGGAPPPDARPLGDLAAEIAVAQVHLEVPAIDLGTAAARPHLVTGWSWDEGGGSDAPFVWGVGERSVVRFFLTEPRDLAVRLRGRPLTFDGSTPQTVEILVDGRPTAPATRLVLDPGLHSYTVTLPEDSLQAGFNTLDLRYAWARSPRELGISNDGRALAVAWYELAFSPIPPPAASDGDRAAGVSVTSEPSPVSDQGGAATVRLPFGAGVDVFVRVPTPPGSRTLLAIDRLRAVSATGSLVVEIEEEGTEPVRAARVGPATRSGRRVLLDLPLRPAEPRVIGEGNARERGEEPPRADGGTRLLRIGLWAVPQEPGTAGALELRMPRLLTTAPAADDQVPEGQAGAAADRTPTPDSSPGSSGEPGQAPAGAGSGDLRPNVIVYLVDTLRADRVGVYSGTGGIPARPAGERSLTPAVDAFAADGGVVFDEAIAQAPWTRPTVATLLTGLGPLAHGVTTLEDRLADDALTLPEILRQAGYRTAAFSTNWHVTEATGMAQGFDDFIFLPDAIHSEAVERHVVRWLDEHREPAGPAREPFFLYVHTLDPHAPYEPPADLRRRFAPEAPPDAGSRAYLERIYAATGPGTAAERAELMAPIPALYDAEVAGADRGFGMLLDALRARGLYDDTLIVFLADHGEELGEHGHLGHGYDLYRETLHIPWIVRLPGGERPGGRAHVAARVQQTDLLPTLLGALGVTAPADLPGVDLFAGSPPSGRPAFSHLDYEGRRALSVAIGPWTAIEPLSAAFGRWPELYELERDPNELVSLGGWDPREPVRLGFLRTLIRRHLAGGDSGALAETTEIDPATRRGLEALGYL